MKLEFEVPEMAAEVVKTAVDLVITTMQRGAAVNAEGSWANKDPLTYHFNKALHHILRAHHEQDMLAVEKDEPHHPHVANGFTRIAMAECLRRKAMQPKGVLVEAIDE